MQSSAYNNPLFANGLARLVQSFIGNPAQQGQAELAASQALLNNQTAQYREAIGDTGLSGDLASMMIRALQAGPDYSRYAPTLGREALSMGAMGFGPPQLTPAGGLASAFVGSGRRRGGGGGGAPAQAAPAGYVWNDLPVTGRNAALSALRRAMKDGLIPDGMTEAQAAALLAQNPGGWANEQEALLALTNPDNFERDMTEVVTNPPGTMLSRLFGLDDGVPDATEMQPTGDWRFRGAATAAAPEVGHEGQVLNQAREAIRNGKDPAAVAQRLVEMGIDPNRL